MKHLPLLSLIFLILAGCQEPASRVEHQEKVLLVEPLVYDHDVALRLSWVHAGPVLQVRGTNCASSQDVKPENVTAVLEAEWPGVVRVVQGRGAVVFVEPAGSYGVDRVGTLHLSWTGNEATWHPAQCAASDSASSQNSQQEGGATAWGSETNVAEGQREGNR